MPDNQGKKKFYVLGAWAYPSGDIHMGHVRNYTITDVVARYKRMNDFNVLNPVGWDAFGLPTENAALKRNLDPFTWNDICTKKMEQQMRTLGISYDWDKVIDTSHPDYYRWTQWLLIRFYEKGLLYKATRSVNWCTSCQTVLANEQIKNDCCERCKSEVIKKDLDQWFLRITAYADRLLEDMKLLKEWPEHILKMQENWIGRKEDGTFRIQDWCISRQRYWGAPIPFVECANCGIVPVPDVELPVLLPKGLDFSPGWPPPLARDSAFVGVACPKCSKPAKRSTEVLDTFVFSSYYFLRFTDPHNGQDIFSAKDERYWMPVDFYISGVELANNHLIYARFFQKAMFDMGMVSELEPFKHFFAQGMILKDGEKMSKSKGNIVSPAEIINQYGADTLRLFILFLGPPEADIAWDDNGIKGCYRFLQKIDRIVHSASVDFDKNWKERIDVKQFSDEDLRFRFKVSSVIAATSDAVEKSCRFNTAISSFMELLTDFELYLNQTPNSYLVNETIEHLIIVLSLFAPHLAEELWEKLGYAPSVCQQSWPSRTNSLFAISNINVVVQVNGKKKGVISLSYDQSMDESVVIGKAMQVAKKSRNDIIKVVFVPGRVINLVV